MTALYVLVSLVSCWCTLLGAFVSVRWLIRRFRPSRPVPASRLVVPASSGRVHSNGVRK